MARRPSFGDEPMSRLAAWSGRLALFALAVTALSIIILRSGLLEIVPALATFAAALVFAGLAVLLALASFVVIWRQGLAGLGYAVMAMFLGLLLLAYPAYLGYRATKLPAISDITTDPANPPRFDALARMRPRERIAYPGAATANLQRAAYPDIVPLQLDVSPKARLRRRARARHQTQMAAGRYPPAGARPPRGRDRGGGAHADHGLSRRRGDPREPGRSGFARRSALGLACRHPRFRRQCLARAGTARGHRRCGQFRAGAASRAGDESATGKKGATRKKAISFICA